MRIVGATLCYDSGIQGWETAVTHNDTGVFIQYINTNSGFEFSNYLYGSNYATFAANNALQKMDATDYQIKLRQTVNLGDPEKDSKFTLYSNSYTNNAQHGTYIYTASNGADSNTSTNVSQLSGKYVIPKKAAIFNLLVNPIKGKLTEMTPTVRVSQISSSSNTLGVTINNVNGFSAEGTIYIRAYDDYNNAKALNTQYIGQTLTVQIDNKGKPDQTMYELQNLAKNKKYYIAFYYVNPLGESVLLIDFDTTKSAIKEASTSSDVVITFTQNKYVNKSYADKSYQFKFNLNRTYNVYLQYDIFATQQDANNNTNVLIDYLTLDSNAEDDILTCPTALTATDNNLKLNLTPQYARHLLLPGVTYYLRVSAFETNGDPVGFKVQSFKIDPVINTGSLVYVANATPNSLKFQVSIDDKQFSIMGASGLTGENIGGLYAVRFVDSEGRLIHTSYDNQVFKTSELKKMFTLDSTTNLNAGTYHLEVNGELEMNSLYSLLIYAAVDANHDGILEGINETEYLPGDLFDTTSSQAYKDWGEAFNEIIDSFWDLDTNRIEGTEELENIFLISKTSQKTTNESGWVISDEGISLERTAQSYYRIKLNDSYGLIAENIPVFKRIEWSVTGYTDTDIINDSGTLKYSNTKDKLIEKGQNAGGYDFYYLQLPNKYTTGEYVITVQLYMNETDESPTKVITKRS